MMSVCHSLARWVSSVPSREEDEDEDEDPVPRAESWHA